MKLKRVKIENYRAIEELDLTLDPDLTVFHGPNGHGKTSVLSAIAVGLGSIPRMLPNVSGIDFLKTDLRGSLPLLVALTTRGGIQWYRRRQYGRWNKTYRRDLRKAIEAIVAADSEGAAPHDLPIVAFYDTDRAVFDTPHRRRGFKTEFPRYAALEGALAPRANFREFFKWFYALENEELREKKARRNWDYQLKELNAVRTAIERMVPGVSDPRIELRPLRFAVSVKPAADKTEELALDQLSGGYRIMLALAADLARRMAQGNPHLDDPLESEAIVLIDEVDLHLHPKWQQRVLTDLAATFPNAQFIVSTHSPQVLSTVRPERVIELRREESNIVAGPASAPTYGAEAGNVLEAIMGVRERPAGNEFTKTLKEYMELVGTDRGESEEGQALRRKLEKLSPDDYGLDRADIEMRRRKVLKRMGRSP